MQMLQTFLFVYVGNISHKVTTDYKTEFIIIKFNFHFVVYGLQHPLRLNTKVFHVVSIEIIKLKFRGFFKAQLICYEALLLTII